MAITEYEYVVVASELRKGGGVLVTLDAPVRMHLTGNSALKKACDLAAEKGIHNGAVLPNETKVYPVDAEGKPLLTLAGKPAGFRGEFAIVPSLKGG